MEQASAAFEAHCSRPRLIGVAALGLGFAALGWWLAIQPVSLLAGPVMQVDAQGIYWHRWSPEPIPRSNVAKLRGHRVSRQRMLGITLVDRSLNHSRGLLGRLAALNAASGFGDVSLMMQGTNRSHDELLAAVAHFDPR